MREGRPNTNTGTPRTSPPPPFNEEHHANGKRGGTNTQTGRSASQHPPFTYYATPPRHATPTIHNAPPTTTMRGGACRGYPTTRTAQRDMHHPQCRTWQGNSARHDTVLANTALGVDGIAHTHWVWQTSAAHTTAIPHTTTEEDGHHPLTTSHCSRSNNQRTIMINVDQHQRSLIDQSTMNDEHDDDQ